MKKTKQFVVAMIILGTCIINILTFYDAGSNEPLTINQLRLNIALASEGSDPNIHYGFVKDYDNNCCKRRYHDDECKGVFC